MADGEQRPAPSGIADWTGEPVTLHLTGAGRVRTVKGRLQHLGGDGFLIVEDDTDWWIPREHVQAVSRSHDE